MVEFICYNWMPLIADHVMDIPENFYKQAGTSRLHNIDNFNPYLVKDNDLIFVKTDFIVNGLFVNEILDKIYKRFNLITGISSYHLGRDGGDIYKKILEHPNLNKWICTNPPDTESNKIIPIPIGFEEPDRPGGDQKFFERWFQTRTKFEDKEDLIFLPYHNLSTNLERKNLVNYLSSLPFVRVQREKQTVEDYFSSLDKYKFVIGIEGSGPDIHRNYETMLVGSVPVSLKNVIERVFSYHNAQGIFLKSWQDLTQDTFDSILTRKYNIDHNDEFIKVKTHISKIRSLI